MSKPQKKQKQLVKTKPQKSDRHLFPFGYADSQKTPDGFIRSSN